MSNDSEITDGEEIDKSIRFANAQNLIKQARKQYDDILEDSENGIDYEDEFLIAEILACLGELEVIKREFPELIDEEMRKIMGSFEFMHDQATKKIKEKFRREAKKKLRNVSSRSQLPDRPLEK